MIALKNLKSIQIRRQRGVVLVVVLIMLVMVTLLAVSSMRSSLTELQITGNDQVRKELASATQECIEQQLSSLIAINNMITGSAAPTSCTTQGGRYSVTIARFTCIKARPLGGSSLAMAASGSSGTSTTEIDYWEVVATVTDTTTGAKMTTTQGFRVRMPLNSCPV